jgi:hypothetical protein
VLKNIEKIKERVKNLIEIDNLNFLDEIKKIIVQEILVYRQENNLSYEELIQKIGPRYSINAGNIKRTPKGKVNIFILVSLSDLVSCAEKLSLTLRAKIIPRNQEGKEKQNSRLESFY